MVIPGVYSDDFQVKGLEMVTKFHVIIYHYIVIKIM